MSRVRDDALLGRGRQQTGPPKEKMGSCPASLTGADPNHIPSGLLPPNAQAEARATGTDTRAGRGPALWPVAFSALLGGVFPLTHWLHDEGDDTAHNG